MTLGRILLIVVATALAGCAGVKELEVTTPLAPMPQPEIRPGYTEVVVFNGTEMTSTLVSEDMTTRSWSRTDGCTVTTPKAGFGPALAWANCNGGTGSASAKLQGETWPLTVGKTWSYDYSGVNSRGNKWSGTRTCAVKAMARIPTRSGEEDTYKVSCSDPDSTYTYYVSPARKATVRYEQSRRDGWRVLSELIRTN
jgi:hypothetical protein